MSDKELLAQALREYPSWGHAYIAMRAERDAAVRERDQLREWGDRECGKALAAERAAEQAQEALRRVEEEARQGKIHSESVSINEEWPVHETIHRFSVIRQVARAALTGEGTE